KAGTYTYAVTAIDTNSRESEKITQTVSVRINEDLKIVQSFSDIIGDEWYAEAIYDLVNQGLIQGYLDGTVRPNDTITRGDAAIMMTRALNESSRTYQKSFPDV